MTDAVDLAKRISMVIHTAERDAERLYRDAMRRKEPTIEAFGAIYNALQNVKDVCQKTITGQHTEGNR